MTFQADALALAREILGLHNAAEAGVPAVPGRRSVELAKEIVRESESEFERRADFARDMDDDLRAEARESEEFA